MTKLEAAGWRIRQLFPGILGGRRTDRDVATEAGSAMVQVARFSTANAANPYSAGVGGRAERSGQ